MSIFHVKINEELMEDYCINKVYMGNDEIKHSYDCRENALTLSGKEISIIHMGISSIRN